MRRSKVVSFVLGLMRATLRALPAGRRLPEGNWNRRHRALIGLVAAHALGLPIFALSQGFGLVHSLAEGAIVAVLALVAVLLSRTRAGRRPSALVVSLGLLTCSALAVHISHGSIEAHFHFFVVMSLLLLYEDWLAYLLALAYVLVHHGALGAAQPGLVFNHDASQGHPLVWAGIHAAFIAANGVANVVSWRLNEDIRAESEQLYVQARDGEQRLAEAEALAHLGSWEWDLARNDVRWSDEMYRIWGVDPTSFVPSYDVFIDTVEPGDREHVENAVRDAVERQRRYEIEFGVVRTDQSTRVVRATGALILDPAGVPAKLIGTAQDVTELKRIERDRERSLAAEQAARVEAEEARALLADQNERLLELDQLKDDLIATVSHELRTPLTSIQGYLELVLEGQAGTINEEQEQFLQVVSRNGERLLRLVTDLLLISRIDAGQLTLETSEVDFAELAREAVEAARPHADAKVVELTLSNELPTPIVADAARLAQLLDNLISNAIKFTPYGGAIHVRTSSDDGQLLLEVRDTGMGIPPEDLERLFDRFYRTDEATKQAIAGTGLGLAIAKAIVDAHGGSIHVESEVGVGTRFAISIPRRSELECAARQGSDRRAA